MKHPEFSHPDVVTMTDFTTKAYSDFGLSK